MLDLSRPKGVPTLDPDRTEKRKKFEEFVRNCKLNLPEEVAELFIDYTRWIWEYKCVGAVSKFYCDQTIFHGENGFTSVGFQATIASTLGAVCAYPDQVNEFVDIIVEGSEEEGYHFGQSSIIGLEKSGWSKDGPPTGKWLGKDGVPAYSICELTLKKIDGRWRVYEEWVVEGTEVRRMTQQS